MPTKRIPIHLGSNKQADEAVLDLGAELRDGYADELNNVVKRPGVVDFANTSQGTSPVQLVYPWDKQEKGVVVAGGKIFTIDDATGTLSDVTGSATLSGNNPVTVADYGSDLYLADGANIVQVPATGTASNLADADAPTAVTHIAVLDTYLIAFDSGQRIKWSVVNDPTTWQGEFAEAETLPDDLQAIGVQQQTLWLFGKRSIEPWRDDGVTPFVKEAQGYIDSGVLAPYSVTDCGGTWYWIDGRRNLCRMIGRQYEMLPRASQDGSGGHESLTNYLTQLGDISDAQGYYMFIGGREYYVLTMPTVDKTIVYDIAKNQWYQWSFWSESLQSYTRYIGHTFGFLPWWNLRLIGHKNNGRIYEPSMTQYADGRKEPLLDSDGETVYDSDGEIVYLAVGSIAEFIRTRIRTGTLTHGTNTRRKMSHEYTLLVKRTNVQDEQDLSSISIRFRDDGSETWKSYKPAAIASIDPTTFVLKWRRNGSYYNRQIEIINEDPAPLILGAFEETFEYANT